jgi:hypothetical protein
MNSSPSTIAATPTAARRAVSAIFFLNGVVLASWVAHIPAVKAQHGLGDDGLGLVLLAMAVGAVSSLPLAAWLIARWGSRCITAVASVAFCLALPLPIVAPSARLVAAALAVFGAMNALLDVCMNAQAVMVEDGYRRPIMPAFHALFSAGGVVGACVASTSMASGLGAVWHVSLVTALSLTVLASALRRLLPPSERPAPAEPVFAWPQAALFPLASLTFCALLAEGAMGDWSAVYLRDALGTTGSLAAGGFAAFSLTMAAGRFGGTYLAERLGGPRLLRCSGIVAAAGLGFALIAATPWSALIGFGLVGLGLANVIPVVFSAAGRVPGVPAGTGLAAAATTGYGAYLAGPPLIGFAAGAAGLPVALAILVASCASIAFLAYSSPALAFGAADSMGGNLLPRCARNNWIASSRRLRRLFPDNGGRSLRRYLPRRATRWPTAAPFLWGRVRRGPRVRPDCRYAVFGPGRLRNGRARPGQCDPLHVRSRCSCSHSEGRASS